MLEYVRKLFDNAAVLVFSSMWGCISAFLFPSQAVMKATIAVLIIMGLDIATKLFALARQNGGLIKAFKDGHIRSSKFAKGTFDKLLVFGVMLICVGAAYQLVVVEDIAVWFAQTVFTLMFLRDLLSVFENLNDAGIKHMGIFKRVIKKKMKEFDDDSEESESED